MILKCFLLYNTTCDVFSVSSVLPLLRDSVGILMQRTPRELDHVLPGCYQRVSDVYTCM